jgi:hypothetical protein
MGSPSLGKFLKKKYWFVFGPTGYEDYDEALSRVKQKGTLREYQKEFEKLANRVIGCPQKALIGTFLGGLKAEISSDVRKFKPRTLRATIEFARMREDELNHMKKSTYSDVSKYSPKPPWESSPTMTPSLPKITGSQVKKLSWDEMQQRREKGLCFNCNERYTPSHQCTVPQLFIIEAEAKDNDSLEGETIPNEDDDSRNPTISLHV